MGLREILSLVPDLVLDVPTIHTFLAFFISEAANNNCIPHDFVGQLDKYMTDNKHVDKLKALIKINPVH